MPKKKYYVVWVGRQPGIYSSWADTQAQVNGFSDAKYKSFSNQAQADEAFQTGWQAFYGKKVALTSLPPEVVADSISVDAACSGSPGNLEYRGVATASGAEIFHKGPIPNGTNNLGEFIAIVHALILLKEQGQNSPIYSDSRTALAWVKNKQVGSKLPRTVGTDPVWSLADRALTWLEENDYANPLLKWKTEEWGEIRADFGRK